MTTYPKMDRKIKARWVKALRSGKYRQTKDKLRRETHGVTSHCCLGVLCELVQPKRWRPGVDAFDGGVYHKGWGHTGGVRRAARLSREAATDLADLNDSGKRFRTIATWIEKHL